MIHKPTPEDMAVNLEVAYESTSPQLGLQEPREAIRLTARTAIRRAVHAEAERDRLKAAIQKHYDQKSDDRCWEDDDWLYAAAGLPAGDHRVGDKEAMLKNCERFLNLRCINGGWKTYAELEAILAAAQQREAGIVSELNKVHQLLTATGAVPVNPNALMILGNVAAALAASEPANGEPDRRCPVCGRLKATCAGDIINSACPKWYATHDQAAENDCRQAAGSPAKVDPPAASWEEELSGLVEAWRDDAANARQEAAGGPSDVAAVYEECADLIESAMVRRASDASA